MSSLLDEAVDISELGQNNLWTIWGKSGSGKTKVGASFPKPMLYIPVGDDGSNTIANVDGIRALPRISSSEDLKQLAKELAKDKKYKSIFVDTFSLVTNEWVNQNVILKKKRMTQQLWGDLKIETEELIRLFHKAAKSHYVILSCHETMDTIDGMEDEIMPDACPSVTKGARTYLQGMTNFGIHLTKVGKTITDKNGEEVQKVQFIAHLGANPYYWTKLQIDPSIKVPPVIVNPSFKKIMKAISPE